eukprot:CAMPEP_0172479358 /NCGR_PEP_ID=MMETSP1066-20121228/3889_1 /TAXON_ID=671091 /ORGANISM="Coscinodiscus wailesii, Strain CCMP2513" /LENGTH=249 /DNA_ID=CAMNT_0013239759 /DNA_START=218 /DNA_END=967 /DNA_ORIENTATION=-
MSTTSDSSSRRAFLTTAAITAAAVAGTGSPQPALAFGGSALKKADAKLAAYGLPGFGNLPDGFSPLVELYGQAQNRDPLLVQFAYPSDWVVQLPNIDVNGEEGTIQAGQYSAGDTATLFVTAGKVDDVTTQPKTFFQDAVIKSISQKGNNMYQNFKITKLAPLDGEYNGQKYMIVDFKYQLLTGAGFEVDRIGHASVTSVGDKTQVLWAATTANRYKKQGANLKLIASSFRVYSDGLTFALKPKKEYDD